MLSGNGARRKIKIYSFDEAIRRKFLTKETDPLSDVLLQIYWELSSKVSNMAFGAWNRNSRNRPTRTIDGYTAISADDVLNDHPVPNISLNVSCQCESDPQPWGIALLGYFVQLSVLHYAVSFGVRLGKDGKRVAPYALLLFTGGTSVLMLGMFLCARIIDMNTIKTRWVIRESESGDLSFAWVQKGNNIAEASVTLV